MAPQTKTPKSEELDDHVRMQRWQQFFSQINHGEFLSEVGETFVEVNDKLGHHASQNGKAKGTITVQLTITHEANGVVTIAPDLKVKLPATVRGKAIFWATEDGSLANEDPRQMKLSLREVKAPAPKTEAKDIGVQPEARSV